MVILNINNILINTRSSKISNILDNMIDNNDGIGSGGGYSYGTIGNSGHYSGTFTR
jgi:hypothetical protein